MGELEGDSMTKDMTYWCDLTGLSAETLTWMYEAVGDVEIACNAYAAAQRRTRKTWQQILESILEYEGQRRYAAANAYSLRYMTALVLMAEEYGQRGRKL